MANKFEQANEFVIASVGASPDWEDYEGTIGVTSSDPSSTTDGLDIRLSSVLVDFFVETTGDTTIWPWYYLSGKNGGPGEWIELPAFGGEPGKYHDRIGPKLIAPSSRLYFEAETTSEIDQLYVGVTRA